MNSQTDPYGPGSILFQFSNQLIHELPTDPHGLVSFLFQFSNQLTDEIPTDPHGPSSIQLRSKKTRIGFSYESISFVFLLILMVASRLQSFHFFLLNATHIFYTSRFPHSFSTAKAYPARSGKKMLSSES